jgi:hypothetical protein
MANLMVCASADPDASRREVMRALAGEVFHAPTGGGNGSDIDESGI